MARKSDRRRKKGSKIRSASSDDAPDQCVFVIRPDAHERFLAMLDAPEPPSPELRALYNRKLAWLP